MGGNQPLVDEAKNYPRGIVHKRLVRMSPTRDRLAALTMQGEDLPQSGNRVDLDRDASGKSLTDVWGVPVARVTYKNHPYELAASLHYLPRMLEVLVASGALLAAPLGGDLPRGLLPPELEGNFDTPVLSLVPSSRHVLGTLRMGRSRADDPHDDDRSVTEPSGRFHDVTNLYAADGCLFPTSGGMNPSLTIMALGYRVGCAIVNPEDPLAVARKIDRRLLDADPAAS